MFTTPSFVAQALPGGKIPHGMDMDDVSVNIPVAVWAHDSGLDYGVDEDGNEYAYQDSPPCDYVVGAFLNWEDAIAYMSLGHRNNMWPEENVTVPLWEFSHTHVMQNA